MAIWSKIYSRLWWKNLPSTDTPINEINLNRTDLAIDTLDDRTIELQTVKAEQSDLLKGLKDVSFNTSTGEFTFTWFDNTTRVIDTLLEKVVTNWSYNKTTQKMVLTLGDGTTEEVDLSSLIQDNEFVDSTTIAFTVSNDGTVQANVRNGSITGDHLQPDYLADVTSQALLAAGSASAAASDAANAHVDAILAQSYAVGGTNTRTDEDIDNAKYYKEQAALSASAAAASETNAATSESNAATSESNAATSESNAAQSATDAANSASSMTSAVSDAQSYANAAQASAENAAASEAATQGAAEDALLAKSYAVGGTGTRAGEDTDNAKWYKEHSAVSSNQFLEMLGAGFGDSLGPTPADNANKISNYDWRLNTNSTYVSVQQYEISGLDGGNLQFTSDAHIGLLDSSNNIDYSRLLNITAGILTNEYGNTSGIIVQPVLVSFPDGTRQGTYVLVGVPFQGATSMRKGSRGMVPAPAAGDDERYLRGDGTWSKPDGGIIQVTQAQWNNLSTAEKANNSYLVLV